MYALEADFEAYGVWGGTTTLSAGRLESRMAAGGFGVSMWPAGIRIPRRGDFMRAIPPPRSSSIYSRRRSPSDLSGGGSRLRPTRRNSPNGGRRLDDRDGRTTAAPGEEAGQPGKIHPWDGFGCRVAPEAAYPPMWRLKRKWGPVGPLKALPCPETSVGGASPPVEGSPTPRLAFAIGAGPYPVGFRLAFALAVLLGG
jgi:hypothetical protein